MKNIFKATTAFIFTVILFSCSDDFKGDIVQDSISEIPVTFVGATTVGGNPYYDVAYSGGTGAFSIVLKIPDNAKLKIKEVTNVIAGSTAINVASITASASSQPQYLAAPAAVNGVTYTLSTSLTEFNTKVTTANKITSAPAAGTFAERAFMIKLTMDDGSLIIPVQVRIRVNP